MSPARVKCPTCQRDLDWENAPFRPFCSERCRLIDLGAWLSGQRSIPGESVPPPENPVTEERPPKRDT
ncbi:MAG TPA: DNA gyrase inhibitor YacG [Steroidobacteraceae bacterium]|jgi:endogenous inhibitor of DNA gyrase (YacG/DUF329 family)|nr:DNA gyrase inhibitor YacG [Steroidobacteraceae bacterium]